MRTLLLTTGLAMTLVQGTARPGEIPRADVWVKNATSEPLPIDIREVHTSAPMQVVLMNGEGSISAAAAAPIRVRVLPQTWTYRSMTIAATSDPASALQAAGADGWETTGLSWTRGQDTVILLKRPR
jgi:hypothetical protein